MVPAGSRFTFTVTGSVPETLWNEAVWGSNGDYGAAGMTVDMLRAGVVSRLASRLTVTRLEIPHSNETWATETWSYLAVIDVETLIDHADVRDVLGIVEGAFWQTTDSPPVVTPGEGTQSNPATRSTGLVSDLTSGVKWAVIGIVALAAIMVTRR